MRNPWRIDRRQQVCTDPCAKKAKSVTGWTVTVVQRAHGYRVVCSSNGGNCEGRCDAEFALHPTCRSGYVCPSGTELKRSRWNSKIRPGTAIVSRTLGYRDEGRQKIFQAWDTKYVPRFGREGTINMAQEDLIGTVKGRALCAALPRRNIRSNAKAWSSEMIADWIFQL